MIRKPALLAIPLAAVFCASPHGIPSLAAQTGETVHEHPISEDPAIDWPALTLSDIDAVDDWVKEVYPAWVDPANPSFRQTWAAAVRTARARVSEVRSRHGHTAIVRALLNATSDPHVVFSGAAQSRQVAWAGIGLERRGSNYVATRLGTFAATPEGAEVADSHFAGCDGRSADDTLRHHLDPWRTAWDIPGNASMYAASIFVDLENPFVPRPVSCRFRRATGAYIDLHLNWEDEDREVVSRGLEPFRRIRPVSEEIGLDFHEDKSTWITVGNFGLEAPHAALRDRIAAERERITSSPYIVIDLRGNLGGNSELADRMIESLWGPGGAQSSIPGREKLWRASDAVIVEARTLRQRLSQWPDVPTGVLAAIDHMIPRLEASRSAGQVFYTEETPFTSPSPAPAPSLRSGRGLKAPVYVLTDGGCVSTCIVAVNALRRAGALQVGDPTQRQTRYVEAWFQRPLPSGYGEVILPIALIPFAEQELGGGSVDLPWTGSANDEGGLKRFIASDAMSRRGAN